MLLVATADPQPDGAREGYPNVGESQAWISPRERVRDLDQIADVAQASAQVGRDELGVQPELGKQRRRAGDRLAPLVRGGDRREANWTPRVERVPEAPFQSNYPLGRSFGHSSLHHVRPKQGHCGLAARAGRPASKLVERPRVLRRHPHTEQA